MIYARTRTMIEKLQRKLDKNQAILITNPYNIEYFTHVEGLSYREREYMILVLPSKIYVITARMFEEQARKSELIQKSKAELFILRERVGFFQTIKELLPKEVKNLFIEEYDFNLAEFNNLKKVLPRVKINYLENQIYQLRIKKTEQEIKLLQKAQKLTAEVLQKAIDYLKTRFNKGVTERELTSFILAETYKINQASPAFDPIVAYNEGSAIPHYIPKERKIGRGVLLIDLGVRYRGYCGDLTRTFYLGNPDKEFLFYYELVEKALSESIKKTRVGVPFIDVHQKAVSEFKKHKLEDRFIHSIGHGVGLEIHERPFVRRLDKKEKLKENTVITIEPGLYFPQKWGIRIEEMVVVKKRKAKVFNVFPRKVENILIRI